MVYQGYCSDITRTVAFGEPTDAQREIYETVRKAEQVAVDSVRPGVKAMEIDKAARNVIEQAGYGSYFTHRVGHGLGISVHEYPSVTGTNELVWKKGWSLQSNRVFITLGLPECVSRMTLSSQLMVWKCLLNSRKNFKFSNEKQICKAADS